MNKWITRDKKLEKKRKRGDIYTKEIPHKDKFTRRDIKQAQKNKSCCVLFYKKRKIIKIA